MESETYAIIFIIFIVLSITHYLAIQLGFKMGAKTNTDIFLSKPEKTRLKTDYEDPFEPYTYDLD